LRCHLADCLLVAGIPASSQHLLKSALLAAKERCESTVALSPINLLVIKIRIGFGVKFLVSFYCTCYSSKFGHTVRTNFYGFVVQSRTQQDKSLLFAHVAMHILFILRVIAAEANPANANDPVNNDIAGRTHIDCL